MISEGTRRGAILWLAAASLTSSCGADRDAVGGSGFVEATKVVVAAQTAGPLEAVYYDEGEKIERGSQVALIDTTAIVLQLRKAAALREEVATQSRIARIGIEQASHNLALSRKEFQRISALLRKGSANQQQYDQAENAHNQSQLAKQLADANYVAHEAETARVDAEIGILKDQLRHCYPLAPVSGLITNRYVEPGELAGLGRPIVEIAKLDTVWVKIFVPARDLTRIAIGGGVDVDPEDGRATPLPGRVSWISEEAEFTPKNVQTKEARADLVYALKVTIPNEKGMLKIGMPVFVTLP